MDRQGGLREAIVDEHCDHRGAERRIPAEGRQGCHARQAARANAVSSSTAIALKLDKEGSKHLEDAIRADLMRRTATGRLYLDKAAQPSTEGWGFVLLLIILITLSVVAAGFALTFIL